MKLLRAFIEASGFDIEVIEKQHVLSNPLSQRLDEVIQTTDYKVARRELKLPKLTDEETKQIIDPNKPINGYVIHIEDDNE